MSIDGHQCLHGRKTWHKALFGLVLSVLLSTLHAQTFCTFSPPPSPVDFGAIPITDVPKGHVLGGKRLRVQISANCPVPAKGDWWIEYAADHVLVPDMADTWETGIPGVGLQVERIEPHRGWISKVQPGKSDFQYLFGGNGLYADDKTGTFEFALVRTGELVAGTYEENSFKVNSYNQYLDTSPPTEVPITVVLLGQTCTVDLTSDTNRSIDLQPVPASEINPYSAVGLKAFNLVLDCSSNISNVLVTITDTINPANRSDNLTVSGVANVALRLYQRTRPVYFGPDSSEQGTINQWSAGAPINGKVSVPMQAGYIATGTGAVGAGELTGKATFTLSYE